MACITGTGPWTTTTSRRWTTTIPPGFRIVPRGTMPWRRRKQRERTEADWVEVELTYAVEYAERVRQALKGDGVAPICANCGCKDFAFDMCIECGKLYIGPL